MATPRFPSWTAGAAQERDPDSLAAVLGMHRDLDLAGRL
jgi:hypothetical protein